MERKIGVKSKSGLYGYMGWVGGDAGIEIYVGAGGGWTTGAGAW